MPAWLFTILERLGAGLVPLDGDFGCRDREPEKCKPGLELGLLALADPTRRAIYDKLRERPRSVGELAAELPVSRPAVSQHLRVLEGARLVRYRRQGTRHVYRPDPAGLEPLRAYVESLWDDVLEAFAGEDGAHEGGTR